MKEKKFFCDWLDKVIVKPIVIIPIILLLIISCIISYNICNKKFLEEKSQYSESDYEYLIEIANDICDEDNKSINLSSIPNNILVTDIKYTKEQITLTCTLDKDFTFAAEPRVLVIISNNFNDVEFVLPSKASAKDNFVFSILSICFGFLAIGIPLLIISLPLYFVSLISSIRKSQYYTKILDEFKEKYPDYKE